MQEKSSRGMKYLFVFFMLVISISAGFAQTFTKAELIAKISDYFDWPHPSQYNDIWKVPLKEIKDVKPTDKYAKQIDVAVERGIVYLTPADYSATAGYFCPDSAVSRQDAALIFARAFCLSAPSVDLVARYSDAKEVKPDARNALNALLSRGLMTGKIATELKPNDTITAEETNLIFNKITSSMVSPVQAVPFTNAIAPRRYVKLWCPTPGATIYFTNDGTTPTTSSQIYTVRDKGHINEMIADNQRPERYVVYKAFAVKDGMEPSPIQTFVWHLYRPVIDDFKSDLILKGTTTSPTVYRLYNDSESVRPMAWYIEGSKSGIVFDALQTPTSSKNLKEYVEKNIATKPFVLIIGHEHGDHTAQAKNFLDAGIDVYANKRGWSTLGTSGGPFPAIFSSPSDQSKIKNIEQGDKFDLGNVVFDVYALPGHANGNIILHDKVNGLVFSSDIYGCTRAGSADNVAVQQVKADLLLSMAQQVYSNYRKNGGKTTMLFTGHDEVPLADNNLRLFEAALQQVVDKGEAGCSPTLRGNNDAPYSRTTLIGDMWKDGTNWISLKLIGIMGDNSEYLTSYPINYNGPDGYLKYSVLSNIEIEGGELIGTTLTWAPPSKPFVWAGTEMIVSNSLPNMFDPWTYSYRIKVPQNNSSINIIPTTMSTKVKSIKLNGKEVGYRSSNTVYVSDGAIIIIDIIAADGKTTSAYKFTVEK